MTLHCGQSSNLYGKSTRFYKFYFMLDDIQDVGAWRSNCRRRSDLLAPRGIVRNGPACVERRNGRRRLRDVDDDKIGCAWLKFTVSKAVIGSDS